MAEQFCLKWTDFHSCIVSALDSLKCSEDLVDVTLTCEGQNIKAHKVILSACSPYFRGVFKENPCRHPIIILKDVLAGDMTRLLTYMYQGEVTVQEEQLPALLQTAQLLQVSGLTTHTITPQNKNNPQKTYASSPGSLSKRVVPQIVSVPKKSAGVNTHQSPQKDISQVPGLKTAVHHYKKRRNSASEKLAECPPSEVKKCKVSKDKPSLKKSDCISSNAENTRTENAGKDINPLQNMDPLTVQGNHDLSQLDNSELLSTVKVEVIEEEEQVNDPGDEEAENSNSPKPFYETSMLARSLISGTQSLKCDTSSGASNTSKIKQSPGESQTLEVKGEQLSPGGGGLEPEILISEEEGRGVGGPPANHAAICGDCPHCGTEYSNQSALKYHVRLMHSDLTNRLCCYLCPRSFTVRDTFKEHMWTFHGQRN